jgi:hypothetical protein
MTAAKLADNAVVTASVADGAVTQVKTTGVGRGKNIIINGAMQMAQRGASGTTNGYTSLDRWINGYGGGTVTQSQQALTSGSPYNEGHRNFLRATNTAAGSTAATDSLQIYQVIESQNLATSGWDSTSSSSFITVSAWVRSSLAGTYNLRLYIYDGDKNYTSPIVLSANTWTKVTKTIPGAAGNTVNNDNGAGMFVNFAVHLGTNNTVASGFTNNQWATFDTASQATDYAQNWRSTGSATFDVTGVQLEVSSSATDFEHRSFGEELALCQRYYEEINVTGYFVTGNSYSTAQFNASPMFFKTKKRSTPNITFPAIGNTSGTIGPTNATANYVTLGSVLRSYASPDWFQIYNNSGDGYSGFTDDGVMQIYSYGTTTITASSEL